MNFGPVPLEEAEGKILAHNIVGLNGKRVFRKGKALSAEDVTTLRELGRSSVYVAELQADDVDENSASRRVAEAVVGNNLRLSGPASGRTNLLAEAQGVLRIDPERLDRINECDGITLATLTTHSVLNARQMAATVKIIPFAVPEDSVLDVENIAREDGPIVTLDILERQKVGMIISGSPAIREKLTKDFDPMTERVEALGSEIAHSDYIPLEDDHPEDGLATAIRQQYESGVDMIILVGQTAVMDWNDVTPRAVEQAGGKVEVLGVPVDPGNLLMLAYLDGIPVLGAPGCARSRKVNIVDWVLPRLLVGEHLFRSDVIKLGHGGLLDDFVGRTLARDHPEKSE
jgi:molybdenum cofactor cytidylyltransferase